MYGILFIPMAFVRSFTNRVFKDVFITWLVVACKHTRTAGTAAAINIGKAGSNIYISPFTPLFPIRTAARHARTLVVTPFRIIT